MRNFYWICRYPIYMYRVDVRALMFGPIGAVGKCFATGRILTQVRFLACVRSQMDFQILQSRKSLHTSTILFF